jgi:adenosylmethionine-8-amino-7-oxononanoate aminotransferase
VGEQLGAALAPLETYDGVVDIRRIGTMTGVEVAPVGERTGFEVCRAARRRGVIIRPLGDVVVLMPPLGISDGELDELAGVVVDSVHEVVR